MNGINFAGYAADNGAKIWLWDQTPDATVSSGVTVAGTLWSKAGRWEPGDPAPLKNLWPYEAGAAAAINEPKRYRIADMPDEEYAQLLADADARRPELEAQDNAIQRTRGIAAALLLAALALFGLAPRADAAQVVLCAAHGQTNVAGIQVNQPGLSKSYSADGQGCVIANGVADIAVLRGAGYQEPGKERSIVFNTGVASGTTDFIVGVIPAGAYIQQVIASNSTANAVTGNLTLGTTANGTDVVAAANFACGANCLVSVANANIAKQVFSLTASQPLHLAAVTAWNNANITITVVYGYF